MRIALASPVSMTDIVLDVLGTATPDVYAALLDDELYAVLLAWRDEVEARPIPQLVDTPTAIDTIKGAAA